MERDQPASFRITPRQRQALMLVAHGLTDKAIACEMGITVRSVKSLLYGARRRLDAANSAHAVAIAIERDLITMHSELVPWQR